MRILLLAILGLGMQGCMHWAPVSTKEVTSEVIYRQYDSVTIQYRTERERNAILALLETRKEDIREN